MAALHRLEFFFDVGSPTAYLAWTQLPAIAKQADVQIQYKPMLLGGVFKATGSTSPASVPAKGRWMQQDIARWAARYGVRYQHNPAFPINTLTLMRAATGQLALGQPALEAFLHAVFPALWADAQDLGAPETLAQLLFSAGFDAPSVLELAQLPDTKSRLLATTQEAVARGVFGAPSIFVDDVLYFGQDRLEFVREALLG
jgi:2-hydroxychromene-2-carboxylate isomerase